jgi:hypothetical protein
MQNVDARQIQDMRALLAAQPTAEDAPNFTRKLRGFLASRSAPPKADPLFEGSRMATTSRPWPETDQEPLILENDLTLPPWPILSGPVAQESLPLQVLLGDLAPRRPAFGQRREPVLELREPAPAEPRRLTLTAPDGATVGEIILHAADMRPTVQRQARRPFEPLHSEAPFFPEDLADEPRQSSPRAAAKTPPRVAKPDAELAAAFLLATLAARLASEDAHLRERLAPMRFPPAAPEAA